MYDECICCVRSLFQSVYGAFLEFFLSFLELFVVTFFSFCQSVIQSVGLPSTLFFICLNVILMRVSLFILIFVEFCIISVRVDPGSNFLLAFISSFFCYVLVLLLECVRGVLASFLCKRNKIYFGVKVRR